MNTRNLRVRSLWGWLFWLPAAIVAAMGLWQVGRTVYYSFTDFDILSLPEFIGLENYRTMLQDDVTRLGLIHTVVFIVVVGAALMLIGGGLALLTTKLPLPYGVVLGGLLTLSSLFALFPTGWSHLFSGDSYGLLNGLLMHNSEIQNEGTFEPVQWLDVFPAFFHLFQLFVIGLAPVYILVYICTRRHQRQLGLTLAFGAIPVILMTGWAYTAALVGFPSTNYAAHWLPALITDHGNIRCNLGYSSALTVVGILGWILWCAAGALLIRLGVIVYRRIRFRLPYTISWIALVLGGILALLMLFPGWITLQDALKPTEELYLFPPQVFVQRPTLNNFSHLFDAITNYSPLSWDNLFSHLWLLPVAYLLTVLPVAVGLTHFSYRGQKVALLTWLGCWGLLSLSQLDYLHWMALWSEDMLPEAILFAFFRSPLYPLSLLTTLWILRTGLGGKRRLWALTSACIAAQALAVSVWRLLYMYPQHYGVPIQNLFKTLSQIGATTGLHIASAGTLLLITITILPAVLLAAVCLVLSYARKKSTLPSRYP